MTIIGYRDLKKNMIKYSIIVLVGLLVISNSAYGQNNKKAKYWIEISQRNVMTGKSGIYRVKNNRIKRFTQQNEGKVFPKLFSTWLSIQDMDSLNNCVNDLIKNLDTNVTYADYSVLDGFDWSVRIKDETINNAYNFTNCSCRYIDNLIKYLNIRLDNRKMIYPTDYMGLSDCCSSEKHK